MRNTLALDFNGNMFNTMGFSTKNVDVYAVDESDFKVNAGNYKISINGSEAMINISSTTTLNDLANQINASFSSDVVAYVNNGKMLLIPTKSNEFNIKKLALSDSPVDFLLKLIYIRKLTRHSIRVLKHLRTSCLII